MPISPELQAKIDALEDEGLRTRILRVLTGPGKRRVSDEAIYENALAGYLVAKEQQARLRTWHDDEIVAFARYFLEKRPEDYAEFLRQEKEFNEIEPDLALAVRHLIWQWMPDLDFPDCDELFGKFRDYVKSDRV
ncbi:MULTISPECIES: hypothetical protein [Lysobacter]|uniref:Uncharacterized protein n=1 Tax=Lysobacter yananisis TaxID=1003114 RepID=A0ABY9PDQ5_9GAMM|nr:MULTISPECIES: hypothetical protein [Lysobacter]QQQ02058.1 hypothetical protein JHW41_03440 [Lysobacter enzymogenes]WMT05208.1 hypothetical protein RDV84_10295 [Lysobacter yananisis]